MRKPPKVNAMKKIRILHIIYQLNTGGLENGLINLINRLPESQYQHTVLSLSYSTRFKDRVVTNNCTFIDLNKEPGPLLLYFKAIYQIIKSIAPDIVHTRNLSAIECQIVAWAARVPFRIHSEHGRESNDLMGNNKKNQRVRKMAKPFIHQYIALSKDLESYLMDKIGVGTDKINQIYNGVDYQRFTCQHRKSTSDTTRIISVGRLQSVKNFPVLIMAIKNLKASGYENIHLNLVGDGPEKASIQQSIIDNSLQGQVILLGNRNDIPDLLMNSDIFVLPSLIEGISNTILEAMSVGLPIIASRVGGNPELILDGQSGQLFPSGDVYALVKALKLYIDNKQIRHSHGEKSRERVETLFALSQMIQKYHAVYQQAKIEKETPCAA